MTAAATIEALPAPLRAAVNAFEPAFAEAVAGLDVPENLRAAVAHSALGGGKRLRPVLALLSARAVGGAETAAIDAAVALELVHCFSLVHDDLPAMDDDDLRRGRPTLHVHAGEAMAILAGDLMISAAFARLAAAPDLGATVRTALVQALADATSAMIGGQVLDTLGGFPAGLDDAARLRLVHRSKTGALIRAACRMGALSGGADAAAAGALDRYATSVGLMFQIVDDLLDVTQSTEHLGKTAGKDEAAGKLTYPGVLGVEESRAEIARLRNEARSALAPLGPPAAPLAELADFLAVRTR